MAEVLRLENVTRRFKEGDGQLEVFSGLNMTLAPGEIVALVGPSGAGKSSLLHIAGLLEAPTSGEIHIAGAAASGLPVVVGFGIKTPERAAAIARVADGVVVGSALVDEIASAIELNQLAAPKVLESARRLAQAVHAARIEQTTVQA